MYMLPYIKTDHSTIKFSSVSTNRQGSFLVVFRDAKDGTLDLLHAKYMLFHSATSPNRLLLNGLMHTNHKSLPAFLWG